VKLIHFSAQHKGKFALVWVQLQFWIKIKLQHHRPTQRVGTPASLHVHYMLWWHIFVQRSITQCYARSPCLYPCPWPQRQVKPGAKFWSQTGAQGYSLSINSLKLTLHNIFYFRYWVHWVGYNGADSWVHEKDITRIGHSTSTADTWSEVLEQIQLKLSCCRSDECKVDFEVRCKADEFAEDLQPKLVSLGPRVYGRGKRANYHVYRIKDFASLLGLFGSDWFIRVDHKGDHAVIIEDTVRFWLHRPRPIRRKMADGVFHSSNDLTRGTRLHVSFVKRRGSRWGF